MFGRYLTTSFNKPWKINMFVRSPLNFPWYFPSHWTLQTGSFCSQGDTLEPRWLNKRITTVILHKKKMLQDSLKFSSVFKTEFQTKEFAAHWFQCRYFLYNSLCSEITSRSTTFWPPFSLFVDEAFSGMHKLISSMLSTPPTTQSSILRHNRFVSRRQSRSPL